MLSCIRTDGSHARRNCEVNRQLDYRGQLLARLWVGGEFIVVGIWQALGTHDYPPGDIRGNPAFWPVVGGLIALIGIGILFSGLRMWFRRGRSQG